MRAGVVHASALFATRGDTMARVKINFSAQEKDLLKKLGITGGFSSLTDDDLMGIDEAVTEYLMDECIDEDGAVNADGKLCERIIEKLAEC